MRKSARCYRFRVNGVPICKWDRKRRSCDFKPCSGHKKRNCERVSHCKWIVGDGCVSSATSPPSFSNPDVDGCKDETAALKASLQNALQAEETARKAANAALADASEARKDADDATEMAEEALRDADKARWTLNTLNLSLMRRIIEQKRQNILQTSNMLELNLKEDAEQ